MTTRSNTSEESMAEFQQHSISDESSASSESGSRSNEEKTIPFLRRLVDMLRENEDVISFFPGTSKKGQNTLGRIVVHDRLKVESKVLPRYFNHSSFASLRRQLNYFNFTRLGKGRQRGATYCNVGVIELDDILKLKRRPSGVPPTTPTEVVGKRQRSVSISSDDASEQTRQTKMARPTVVSPRSTSPAEIEDEEVPRIALDLTSPKKATASFPCHPLHAMPGSDADVLAGCRALLAFRSVSQSMIA
eukprot:Nitzschia sp. Nitz4//scaffold17_size182527//165399//166428//NITZ4_001882-RA/size182527-processed-gene-0.31-mRNA-1//1//CDS//3329539424//8285//frame0